MGNPKAFLTVPRQEAGYRPVMDRIHDFGEVEQTLNIKDRKLQASRCMDCGVPFCNWACPLGNRAPEWNDALYRGDFELAYKLLTSTNDFPEFTGRICPALCEKACVLNLTMHEASTNRENEAAIIEMAFQEQYVTPFIAERNGRKVAVIGSGPSGLTAANRLNHMGYSVTVYDKNPHAGGLLRYGIPNFKLNKAVVDRRIALMQQEGVEFRFGTPIALAPASAAPAATAAVGSAVSASATSAAIGSAASVSAAPAASAAVGSVVSATAAPAAASASASSACSLASPVPDFAGSGESATVTVEMLAAQYDAVVLCTGTPQARDMASVPGRNIPGVHLALELLSQQNRVLDGEEFPASERVTCKGKNVLVIGGGDTGSDCIGTAHRQGCLSVTQIEIMPKPVEGPDDPANPWPAYPRVLKTTSSHEEGCTRRWNLNTLEFVAGEDGKLCGVRVQPVSWQLPAAPATAAAASGTPATAAPGTQGSLASAPAAAAASGTPASSAPGTQGSLASAPAAAAASGTPASSAPSALGSIGTNTSPARPVMVPAGEPELIPAEIVLLAMGFLKPEHPQYPSNVIIAGDALNGASLVVRAMASGRDAAQKVDQLLKA